MLRQTVRPARDSLTGVGRAPVLTSSTSHRQAPAALRVSGALPAQAMTLPGAVPAGDPTRCRPPDREDRRLSPAGSVTGTAVPGCSTTWQRPGYRHGGGEGGLEPRETKPQGFGVAGIAQDDSCPGHMARALLAATPIPPPRPGWPRPLSARQSSTCPSAAVTCGSGEARPSGREVVTASPTGRPRLCTVTLGGGGGEQPGFVSRKHDGVAINRSQCMVRPTSPREVHPVEFESLSGHRGADFDVGTPRASRACRPAPSADTVRMPGH